MVKEEQPSQEGYMGCVRNGSYSWEMFTQSWSIIYTELMSYYSTLLTRTLGMGQVSEVTCGRKWQSQSHHYATDAKLRSLPSTGAVNASTSLLCVLFPVYICSHNHPIVPAPAPGGSSVEPLCLFSAPDLQRIQGRIFSLLCQFRCSTKDSGEHWTQTPAWLAPLLIHVSRLSPEPSLWQTRKCALAPFILPKLLYQFCHFPLVHSTPMG